MTVSRDDKDEVYENGVLVWSVSTARDVTAEALDARMDAALSGLRTYVANTSPTAAQTAAVVKLLCRVTIAMIRHRFSRYEDVD